MNESETQKAALREATRFRVSFSCAERKRREDRSRAGVFAACVALLKRGIAEIAAVRSSPRLGREEEKE